MLGVVNSLNLWVEVSGDLTIFENIMYKGCCPEISDAFSTDTIQDSNLLLVPLIVSTDRIAALMIGSSTITEANKLV